MMSFEKILLEFGNLREDELTRWMQAELVRPQGGPGAWRFQEIDIARIHLILELRDTMEITEPAFPTVLGLLDQLYTMRRQLRRLNEAVAQTVPEELREALRRHLESQ